MTNYNKLITSVERRRRWSLEEKKQIIEKTYQEGQSVSRIARRYDIILSQLFAWRRQKDH